MPIIIDPGAAWPTGPETFRSADGRLVAVVDAAHNSVRLGLHGIGEMSAIVTRDGTRIYSGDPVTTIGGDGVCSDPFAPFDTDVTYKAVGDNGAESSVVVHTAPMGRGDDDVLFTPLADLTLAASTITNGQAPAITLAGRMTLASPPGASLPSGTWDIPTHDAWKLQVVPPDAAGRDCVLVALSAGPVYVRFLPCASFPDGWCLLSQASAAWSDVDFATDLTLQPVDPPSTRSWTSNATGHTYQDLWDRGTYADAKAAGTYAVAVGMPT